MTKVIWMRCPGCACVYADPPKSVRLQGEFGQVYTKEGHYCSRKGCRHIHLEEIPSPWPEEMARSKGEEVPCPRQSDTDGTTG